MQDETQTYLSCLAEQFLDRLLGQTYTLFGTSQDTGLHRINMFCVALCDQSNSTEANKLLCYRLSNAYDTRDAQDCPECYYQHPYIRWGFSKRGCAVVANLTGTPTTDEFLLNGWLTSVLTNYFYLFLMVLHQKNATYHYLNQIADDPDGSELLLNQKILLAFNSKYIFSVISDEAFIQTVFLQLKQAFQADDVYKELQSQLKQMFDYTQLKESEANERKNNRLNLISVIVTVLCSVSIIFDTIGLLASFGCALGFDSVRNIVCTGVIIFEGILFFVLFLFVAFANKKSK